MKKWNLQHGKDGWAVAVCEVPAWRVALDRAGEWSTHRVFGGLVCCNIPRWLCRVPTGRPRRGEDGVLDNSLAYVLHCMGQRLCVLGKAYRHERGKVTVPLTVAQAREIDAEWVDEWESDMEDESVPLLDA